MPEQYTIKRQLFKLLGAGLIIEDHAGKEAGYCRQKSFRLREDIRVYTDRSQSTELLCIRARSVLDFSTTYDVTLPDGTPLGSLRRKGLKSTFVRDSWLALSDEGQEIGLVEEDSTRLGLARRFLPLGSVLFPQHFEVRDQPGGQPIATIRQHFNLLFYRLGLTIHRQDERFDDLFLLAAACLIAIIEGRQDNNG